MIKGGWSRSFDYPIPLHAALPPLVQKMPQWQTAVAVLMLVVDTVGRP